MNSIPSSPTYDFAAAYHLYDLAHPVIAPELEPEPELEIVTKQPPLTVMFYEDPIPCSLAILDDHQHDCQIDTVLSELERLRFPKIKIATMTMNYASNITDINLTILREALTKPEVFDLGVTLNPKEFSGVNISFPKGLIATNKISIMFFRSGQMTIAGPKTIAEANVSARYATRVLQLCDEAHNWRGKDITIEQRSIRLINLTLKTTLEFNLDSVQGAVSKYAQVTSAIIKSAGVHFNLQTDNASEHVVNVRVFRSGSINVTSVLTAREMGRALLFTHDVLSRLGYDITTAHAPDQCAVRVPKKPGRKSKAEKALCLAEALASVQAIKKQRIV
jgi:TATA-box binding protein (TBP) (component of TFIID and TFIIIB)